MTDPLRLLNFGGGPNSTEVPIVDWDPTNPGTPPNWPNIVSRKYELDVNTDIDGNLQFYLSQTPAGASTEESGPVELTVPADCQIFLSLSGDWNWSFRTPSSSFPGPAMSMSVPTGAKNTRYFNLDHGPAGQPCKQISFYAQLYVGVPISSNFDAFNLYILLDQLDADGNPGTPLAIKLDPDIQNPGDPDPHNIGDGS